MDTPGWAATDVLTLQKLHVVTALDDLLVCDHLAEFVALKQVSSSLYESIVFRNIFVGDCNAISLG